MNNKEKKYSRKEFLKFLGQASLFALVVPPFLTSCGNSSKPDENSILTDEHLERLRNLPIVHLKPTDRDDLVLTKGLDYHTIIKWGDKISRKDTFGFNNDYLCFIPLDKSNPKDGLLWVNHEYVNPLFVSNYDFDSYDDPMELRTKEQIDIEMYNVGGTIVRIKEENGEWNIVKNDPLNRRITAKTPMKLNWDEKINGKDTVIGTNSNCAGGITPWNTFLTCEENYDSFFGETKYDSDNKPTHIDSKYGWEKFYDYPPEHYGWVVEVDPMTGEAQKHIALGRFSHECCTIYELDDKRVVAYTGDDSKDEHLYKFISSSPGSLKEGTLYVADTVNGKWLPLDWESQPLLKDKFANQTEVLIRTREASKVIGATELNRPEDIEIDPITGTCISNIDKQQAKRRLSRFYSKNRRIRRQI